MSDEYLKHVFSYDHDDAVKFIVKNEDLPEIALKHALRLQSELLVRFVLYISDILTLHPMLDESWIYHQIESSINNREGQIIM